ncbi:hypothetical protein EJB05_24029, partial [Eragrostis curvula]
MAPSSPPPDWADLPEDALMTVFERLGTAELLLGASVVCRSWFRLATGEPQLWRRVDLTGCFDPTIDMEAMARAAVDRAAGRLEHFAADRFATDALLEYIAERLRVLLFSPFPIPRLGFQDSLVDVPLFWILYGLDPQDSIGAYVILGYAGKIRTDCLKSLRLLNCMDFSYKGLVVVGLRNPHIEELELTGCLPLHKILKIPTGAVGCIFAHLKCLRLNDRWFDIELDDVLDNYLARGIADSMPELRDLQLFANRLHNNALYDILDKCPHLESLDLRHCFNIVVDAELEARCSKLTVVRFPKDSTKDYEYETLIEKFSLRSLAIQIEPPPEWLFPGSDDDSEDDGDSGNDNEDDGDSGDDNEDDGDSNEDDGDSGDGSEDDEDGDVCYFGHVLVL